MTSHLPRAVALRARRGALLSATALAGAMLFAVLAAAPARADGGAGGESGGNPGGAGGGRLTGNAGAQRPPPPFLPPPRGRRGAPRAGPGRGGRAPPAGAR